MTKARTYTHTHVVYIVTLCAGRRRPTMTPVCVVDAVESVGLVPHAVLLFIVIVGHHHHDDDDGGATNTRTRPQGHAPTAITLTFARIAGPE